MSFDYNQYMVLVHSAKQAYPQWRYGQVLFNVLHDNWPDIANRIRGTDTDPFHHKGGPVIDKFFKELNK